MAEEDFEEPKALDDDRDDIESVEPTASPGQREAIRPFADLQRQLAAIDFPAIRAAQRAVEQSAAFQLSEVWAAQDQVAKHFAESIDFSHLAKTHNFLRVARTIPAIEAQQRWEDSLARAVHVPALERALASSAELSAFTQNNSALTKAVQDQREFFVRIGKSIDFKLPTVEVGQWIKKLDRWIPANLRGIADLEAVATLALDEGLPLSWVPRAEIVADLLDAGSAEERLEILSKDRDEVLDDCRAAVDSQTSEWAVQCGAAIEALGIGLDGPAQSHASNLIDSIVLALHGKKGRETAKSRAQDDFDDLPLQLAAENLTLRPLFRAFAIWFPSSGTAPPEHFARHPTAHAVGHVGVFGPQSALVAVMLATSLTVQYGQATESDDN